MLQHVDTLGDDFEDIGDPMWLAGTEADRIQRQDEIGPPPNGGGFYRLWFLDPQD